MSFMLLGSGGTDRAAGGGGLSRPVSGIIGLWSADAGLTLSGSNVTAWADQSGNGNHLVTNAGSTSGVPTYQATGFNSKPTVDFTAAGNGRAPLYKAAFPIGTGNTLTAWHVGTIRSASQSFARVMSYAGVSHDYNNAGSFLFGRNSSSAQALFMRNSQQLNPGITYSANDRFILTIDSGGAMVLTVNGSATSGATASGNWTSNGPFGLGGGVTDDSGLDGQISEAGVATAYSDATAVAALDAVLQSYWGL